MIWNSSSTPRVKAGRSRIGRLELGPGGWRAPRRRATRDAGCGPGRRGLWRRMSREKLLPVKLPGRRNALRDSLDEPIGGVLEDPLEIGLSHGGRVGVGRGIQKVDRVGDPAPHGELERVEIVAQGVDELQAVCANAGLERFIHRLAVFDVAVYVGLAR